MKYYLKRILSALLVTLLMLSAVPSAQAAIVTRDDGVWYFPLPKAYYNKFSDWCGCPGNDVCPFCKTTHSSWGDSFHTGQGGHNGIDIAAPVGTSVYAPAAGTVYWKKTNWEARGYTVIMEHPIGNGYSYYSAFQHLSKVNVVDSGTYVKAGTKIAETGNSAGSSSGDPHMHFGLYMAASGKGEAIAANVGKQLNAIEAKGWLNSGFGTGRVLNNPAKDSPAGFPTGYSEVVAPLKKHPSTVKYTFDKSEVTLSGDYLAGCTVYPSFLILSTTSATTGYSLPCTASQDSGSSSVVSYAAGETLTAIGLYQNRSGQYWYQIESSGDSHYVFAGDCEITARLYSDVTISNVTAPSALDVGDYFSIEGIISSTYNQISSVGGYIYPSVVASGTAIAFGTAEVNGNSFSLLNSTVDTSLTFNTLAEGHYTYVVRACAENCYSLDGKTLSTILCDVNLVNVPFTVGSPVDLWADLGTDFYAYIENPAADTFIESSDGHVYACVDKTPDTRRIWHFARHSSGGYTISCVYDDFLLTYGTAQMTASAAVGDTTQLWYPETSGTGYLLHPGSDIINSMTQADDGADLRSEPSTNSAGQIFRIIPLSSTGIAYEKPAAPEAPFILTNVLQPFGDDVTLSWSASPLKDAGFDCRRYDVVLTYPDGTSFSASTTDTYLKLPTLPTGNSTVQVTAVNTCYKDLSSETSQSNLIVDQIYRLEVTAQRCAEGVQAVFTNLSDHYSTSYYAYFAVYDSYGRMLSIQELDAVIPGETQQTQIIPVSHPDMHSGRIYLLNDSYCPCSETQPIPLT